MHRTAAKASDGVRILAGQHVVIDRSLLAVPLHFTGAAVALIEIVVGEFAPVAIVDAVDAESVQHVANERLFAGLIGQAVAGAVIMILPALLRMAVAHILNLVRDGIASLAIERVVDRDAIQRNTDHAHRHA